MSRQEVGVGHCWPQKLLTEPRYEEGDACMGVESGDADSDDSTDTVVASGELRSRWREQARLLHTSPAADAAMSDERSRDAAREGAASAPAPSAGTRRAVKKELGSPDFSPGPSGDHRGASAARSAKPTTAPERSSLQGWPIMNPGRPIKTEPLASAVVVAPANVNVKLENAPAVSTDVGINREEVNSFLPANSINADGRKSVVMPVARPTANVTSNALFGSDSDFDEPLSDDGSEMDGFDDFLEGITKELNDGQYSDLRNELFSRNPSPSEASQATDQVVKPEIRSPSRSSSTKKLQSPNDVNETCDPERSGTQEASGVPPAFDFIPDSNKMNALSHPHVGIPPAMGVPVSQPAVAESNIDSGSPQRDAAHQNSAQLSSFVDTTNEVSESIRYAKRYSGTEGLVKRVSNLPASDERLEEKTGLKPDDVIARTPASACSSQTLSSAQISNDVLLGAPSTANQFVPDAGPQVSSSVAACSATDPSGGDKASTAKDISESLQKSVETTEKAMGVVDRKAERRDLDNRGAAYHVDRQSSSPEPGEITTEDIVRPHPKRTETHTIVHSHGMVDQSIQVNSREGDSEGTRKESSCQVAVSYADEKQREMVDTNTQTDQPRISAAALNIAADMQSPSVLSKTSRTVDDGSAKHIDEYCEKTFWLLENFSEGLSKEDDSHKTRSALDSAKEVRDGLNKRHGLPLSHQLNMCTNAVRSMLNALRKLSKRSSKKTARKVQIMEGTGDLKVIEVQVKEKPTEVVQPYTTVHDRLGGPPVESIQLPETRPSVHDRLSYPPKTRARSPETSHERVSDTGTSSDNKHRPGSPSATRVSASGRGSSDRAEGQEHPPKSREGNEDANEHETPPEQATDDSVWASRPLPMTRKRVVEDGYGLSFLTGLRDCRAVDNVYTTALRRLAEKYRLVFPNRARLPEIVQNRVPDSPKWTDILSKKLKSELFTGFGIYLANVKDLQDEFLPLNPFQLNPLPQKQSSIDGNDGANQQQGTPHDLPISGGVRHASGGVRHPSGGVRHPSGGVRHLRHPSGGVRQPSGGVEHASEAVRHAPETVRNAPEAVRHAPEAVRHAPEAVRHAPEAVRHAPEAVRHAPEAVRHAPEAVRHAPEAVRHAPEAVRHAPEAVRHAPEAVRHAPEAVRNAPEAVRHAPEAVRHAPEAVRHAPEVVRHAPEAVRHAPEAVRHAPEAVRHAPEAVRHAPEAVRHAPEVVRHAPEAVRHAPEAVRHAPEAVRHAPEAVRHAPEDAQRVADSVWEAECQQFLEKIRPPGAPPATTDTRQRNRSGQRAPSPAAFVNVLEAAVSNPLARPPAFPPPTVTDPRPPAGRDSGIGAPGSPMMRCLIPLPSSTLQSTTVASGVNVLKRSAESGESMSLSEGDDTIAGWTPPDKPPAESRESLMSEGELTDDSELPSVPSRHASGRTSISPPRSGGSSSRGARGWSGDPKTEAQQLAQKIIREGLDLLDRQQAYSASKRRRRHSDEDSFAARKRGRRQSGFVSPTKVRLDELLCEEHGVIHDDPWETFLHLSTRQDDSSSVCCPLCNIVHAKKKILCHAKKEHGVRMPGAEDSDGSRKSPPPGSPSRRVTCTERSRRRSPPSTKSSRRRAKRARLQASDDTIWSRSAHRSSSLERSPRSPRRAAVDDGWRRWAAGLRESPEKPRDDWPPIRSRHRSASLESTCFFPTGARGRHRSASVESTRFPDRSVRRNDRRSPSDYREQNDGGSSPSRRYVRWRYPRSPRERRDSPVERSRGYSPPDRRAERCRDSDRHRPGSERSRRRTSGERVRRQPSPDRAPRTRVKVESPRRRSRSPAVRLSRTASRKKRLNATTRGKPQSSEVKIESSDASLHERKTHQPKEAVVKPRPHSPSTSLDKTQVTSKVSESSSEKADNSTSSANSGEVSARQLHFEQMSPEAKFGPRLTGLESDSNPTDEKSPSTKTIWTVPNVIAKKKSKVKVKGTRPLPPPPILFHPPTGFSKDELQRIISTCKEVTSSAESKPSSNQQLTPKESCDPPAPDEETDYISVVNDEQCIDSIDEERSNRLQEAANTPKTPITGSVGSHLTILNTEPVKEDLRPSPSCSVSAQPSDSQPHQDKRPQPKPTAKQPDPGNDSQMSSSQSAEGRPKPSESCQGVSVGNSEPIKEKQAETAAAGRHSECSKVSVSASAEPAMAVAGTATPKLGEPSSQTRSVGQELTQRVTAKKRASNPNLIQIQLKKVEIHVRKKAGKQAVDTSKSAELLTAVAGTATQKPDEGLSQTKPVGHQPTQQVTKKLTSDPNLVKIQPKEVSQTDQIAILQTEKAGEQRVETDSRNQASTLSDMSPSNQQAARNSTVSKEVKLNFEKERKQAVEPESTERQTPKPVENDTINANESHSSDVCTESKQQDNANDCKVTSIVPVRAQPILIDLTEEAQDKGATSSAETINKTETKSTQEQPSTKVVDGNTAPAEQSKDGVLKPGDPDTTPIKPDPDATAPTVPGAAATTPDLPDGGPHRCPLCRVMVASLLSLRNHTKMCAKSPPPCATCYRKVTNHKAHRARCRGQAPWLCSGCHKWCVQNRFAHSKLCPAQCTQCGVVGVHVCRKTPNAAGPAAFAPRGVSPAAVRGATPAFRPRAASSRGRFRPRGASPVVQRFPSQRGGRIRPLFPPMGPRPEGHRGPAPLYEEWVDGEGDQWCDQCGMWGHNCQLQDVGADGFWRDESEPWEVEQHWEPHGHPPGPLGGDPDVCAHCGTWGRHQCLGPPWRPGYDDGWQGHGGGY